MTDKVLEKAQSAISEKQRFRFLTGRRSLKAAQAISLSGKEKPMEQS